MTDLGLEVRRWLEFALELGIDDLPVTLTSSVAAGSRAGKATTVSAVRSTGRPASRAVDVKPASRPGASAGAGQARDRSAWQRAKALMSGSGSAASTSTSTGPRAGAASVVATAATRLPRMGAVPAELLAIPNEDAAATSDLDAVQALVGDCRRCKLCERRTKVVFGSGSPEAELMFVGEGPGRDEDLQGLPFVGRAGQLLTDIIKAIGRTRDEVYIANVVKCRPPQNRNPQPDEIAMCRGFLYRQMAVIRPRVVVALGKPATELLLDRPVSIMAMRGQELELFGAKLIPTFHPAFLLRTPERKRDVWEDMKKVRDLLALGR